MFQDEHEQEINIERQRYMLNMSSGKLETLLENESKEGCKHKGSKMNQLPFSNLISTIAK